MMINVWKRGLGIAILSLSACGDGTDESASVEVVRGLKAFQVSETADTMARRYPSIVRPAQESMLSFEVSGQLTEVTLEVGQAVSAGDVLATLDPRSLELTVEQSRAALDQARANYRNARADFDRKAPLLESGFVTEAAYEQSENAMQSSLAQVEQAQKQLDISQENLSKAQLVAPFDGLVSSVEAESFSSVSPGQAVLGLYSESAFELAFSVPATVINTLSIGQQVHARFSDFSVDLYRGRITEIGSRAAQVSAFPVVVGLEEAPVGLKAGMAAEAEIDVVLEGGRSGILIPLSSVVTGTAEPGERQSGAGTVFVYDPETSTVSGRHVKTAGIRENMLIVYDGLQKGELIAAAGVTFLKEGQKVKLLPLED